MGCRIIIGYEAGDEDTQERQIAVMYDSTAGRVFGRIFEGTDDEFGHLDAHDECEAFIDWSTRRHEGLDPRHLSESELAKEQMHWWRARQNA